MSIDFKLKVSTFFLQAFVGRLLSQTNVGKLKATAF